VQIRVLPGRFISDENGEVQVSDESKKIYHWNTAFTAGCFESGFWNKAEVDIAFEFLLLYYFQDAI
jgi:hypothetical protein